MDQEMKARGFRRWEMALLLGVAVALLAGTWLSGQQAALSNRVVRIHVIGASDSEEDQAVKLLVRDAVLEQAQPWLEGVSSPEEAQAVLMSHLAELAQVGSQVAGVAVTASVEENIWFPTKVYQDFSLPAGRYTALRIILGEGKGQNWWCVVFPPLCMGAVSETEAKLAGGFSENQVRLITGENEGYVVKFRLLEWWNKFIEKR